MPRSEWEWLEPDSLSWVDLPDRSQECVFDDVLDTLCDGDTVRVAMRARSVDVAIVTGKVWKDGLGIWRVGPVAVSATGGRRLSVVTNIEIIYPDAPDADCLVIARERSSESGRHGLVVLTSEGEGERGPDVWTVGIGPRAGTSAGVWSEVVKNYVVLATVQQTDDLVV